MPTGFFKGDLGSFVSLNVRLKFLFPPSFPGFWGSAFFASLVSMPKAPIDENCETVSWQNDIWFSGQISPMYSEP